ncbi:hypothetical protein [Legionella septentrionalis]|uniref:hypothetical protein n=1 Tax=Legionella septentrionalis TaxID=2498109 RepID=UPI000F8D468A|nr:hypothetical protein [Legionella septentrionalis]RUR09714.1 hypothetical protein ELY14_07895 [Legionella septentrionalis]
MQKSELIKKAQHSDSITRDEFAIILAQHNKSMATTIEFQGYIFSAQEAGTIEPLHRSLEEHRIAGLKGQSVRAQFWNFKFKTIDLGSVDIDDCV